MQILFMGTFIFFNMAEEVLFRISLPDLEIIPALL